MPDTNRDFPSQVAGLRPLNPPFGSLISAFNAGRPGRSRMNVTINNINVLQMSPNVIAAYYEQCSSVTGNHVTISSKFGGLPVIIGRSGEPTFLFEVIDVWEGLIDYDDIVKHIPNISYSQVSGAIEFVRKLTQFNIKGVDIDELGDEFFESMPEFQEIISKSVRDEDSVRVLNTH